MGFFSWHTNDTDRSIANRYQDSRKTFTVYMIDNKGNRYVEEEYEGYGVFGNKDYFELLAEMNFPDEAKKIRSDLILRGKPDLTWPNGIKLDDLDLSGSGGAVSITLLRNLGLDLRDKHYHKKFGEISISWPNLVEDPNAQWKNEESPDCPYQGYFYGGIEL
tara:strand:- start:365 stop:850 length:486 start_codon:yes stop_codon:yes gene_type:complete